jgi:hypothetical protein
MIKGDLRWAGPDERVCSPSGDLNVARTKPKPTFQVKALTIVCSDRWRSDRFYKEVLGAVALPGDLG